MKMIKKSTTIFFAVLVLTLLLSFSSFASAKPLKPTGFKAVAVAADKVNLSWNKSASADFYRVYESRNGKWALLRNVKGNSYSVSGLTASKTYNYAVVSVNEDGGKYYFCDGLSTAAVKTKALSATTVSALAGGDYVALSWKKVPGAQWYNIYGRAGGAWKFVKTLTANNLSYTVSGLKSNTAYQFLVRPVTSGDGQMLKGPNSNIAKVTTLRANKVAVKNVANTQNSVTLRWTKAADSDGYRVYQNVDGKWKNVKTVYSRDTLQTVISPLESDKSYSFCVRAFKRTAQGTVWFVTSDICSATTDPTLDDLFLHRTDEVAKIINGKSFTLSYKTDNSKYGRIPVVVYKNGNNYRINSKVNETNYALINTANAHYVMLTDKKVYFKVPSVITGSTDIKSAVDDLLPGADWEGKVSLSVFDGKKVVCETYVNRLKTRAVKYYYRADILVGIEEYSAGAKLVERAYVTGLKNAASVAWFRIPGDYNKIS